MSEGYLSVENERLWYRRMGTPKAKPPLLCLAGGPGLGSAYMEPMEALGDEREVIIFDELGSGRSAHLEDAGRYGVALSVAQIEAVVDGLNLARVHLLSHSGTTFSAVPYTIANPSRVASFVWYSGLGSIEQWLQDQRRLRDAMLAEAEIAPDQLIGAYYARHACRVDPWPEPLARSAQGFFADPTLFNTLYGPDQFTVNGAWKSETVLPLLPGFPVDVLAIRGEHDYATAEATGDVVTALPRVRAVTFPDASHFSHIETPGAFFAEVRTFLREHD